MAAEAVKKGYCCGTCNTLNWRVALKCKTVNTAACAAKTGSCAKWWACICKWAWIVTVWEGAFNLFAAALTCVAIIFVGIWETIVPPEPEKPKEGEEKKDAEGNIIQEPEPEEVVVPEPVVEEEPIEDDYSSDSDPCDEDYDDSDDEKAENNEGDPEKDNNEAVNEGGQKDTLLFRSRGKAKSAIELSDFEYHSVKFGRGRKTDKVKNV